MPDQEASTFSYQAALDVATELATAAGKLILAQFVGPAGIAGHGGHADVDAAAERLIRDGLAQAFPQYGQRGEEIRELDRPASDPGRHVWLIDPHDGTSEATKGHRGAAVSIALLRDGVPVLGVVYAYAAPGGGDDLFAWAEGCGSVRRGGLVVDRRPWATAAGPDVVVLMSQSAEKSIAPAITYATPARVRCLPSIAYRLALVAAGDAEAATSFNGPIDWDYAGGHALILGAGGRMQDHGGNPVRYAPDGRSSVGAGCVGGAPVLVERFAGATPAADMVPQAIPPKFGLVRPAPGKIVADAAMVRRACGCLMGQLAGDNLGAYVEFQSDTSIRGQFPGGLRILRDGGHWNLLAGQPTDDSELALMLARSIVAEGRYEPARAAEAYGFWYASGPFDIGTTTRHAVSPAAAAVARGENALVAASQSASATSQANGSLMRVSPLGIYGAGRSSVEVVDLAVQDSAITHNSSVCRGTTGVFAAAVAYAIGTGNAREVVYEHALTVARESGVDALVLNALRKAETETPGREDFNGASQGWVLVAFQNAFFQLLHASTLEEGVVDSVMRGGDTDTNAAIAGALLGAVHGLAGVSDQWCRSVLSCRPLAGSPGVHRPRPVDFWPVDALALAERLLWLGMNQGGP